MLLLRSLTFALGGGIENLGRESLVMYAPLIVALLNEGDACKKEDKEFLCSQLLAGSMRRAVSRSSCCQVDGISKLLFPLCFL